MKQHKEGILLNFEEEPGSISALLVAYIKKAPGNRGDKKLQDNLISDIINLAGIDMKEWQTKSFKITPNAWGVTMKQKKFEAGQKETGTVKNPETGEDIPILDYAASSHTWAEQAYNYQLKVEISFERIAPTKRDQFKKELLKQIRNTKRSHIVSPKSLSITGRLLLLDLPDHHLGRLSWGRETGDNYDLDIAVKRYRNSISFFLEEAYYLHKKHPIEEILFVVGNDFFNYDYAKPYPHTSNNTPQESDVRFQKMFSIGSGLVVEQLEECSKLAKVKIVVIPGNHDEMTSFMLGEVLAARFYNHPNIEVNVSPKLREIYNFGKCFIGFSHGQYESFERLYANMANETGWEDSIYKHVYTGHLHHKETKVKVANNITVTETKYPKNPVLLTEDLNGVMFDRLASLTSNDYYEASRGYIHIKQAESFLFDRELGCTGTIRYQLPISIKNKGNR